MLLTSLLAIVIIYASSFEECLKYPVIRTCTHDLAEESEGESEAFNIHFFRFANIITVSD
jgi:hypothetical protein